MGQIGIEKLEKRMIELCIDHGLCGADARVMSEVYMRASYRGVGHHDIHDLFGRFNALDKGLIKSTPQIKKISEFGGMEVWDGDCGLGEICTYHVTKRSMALAQAHGIGFATIRNSNHFLAAAPYVEMADEGGFLTIVMSKSPGGLSLPGADKNIMGNNPFGFAASYGSGQILLDICNAYSSFGKMQQKMIAGESVPEYWGNDAEGRPTSDAKSIFESGLYMPMGEHKGFGMAIMIELFTSIIAEGAILNEDQLKSGLRGSYTQTAISIDVSKLMPELTYRERVKRMTEIFKHLYPDIYIPGQRSMQVRQAIQEKGYFEMEDSLLEKLGQ